MFNKTISLFKVLIISLILGTGLIGTVWSNHTNNQTMAVTDLPTRSKIIDDRNYILESLGYYAPLTHDEIVLLDSLGYSLKELQNRETLSLVLKNIDDSQAVVLAKALKDNKSLQTLNLNHNQIGHRGAIALAES
jgi:hypothetical protein